MLLLIDLSISSVISLADKSPFEMAIKRRHYIRRVRQVFIEKESRLPK